MRLQSSHDNSKLIHPTKLIREGEAKNSQGLMSSSKSGAGTSESRKKRLSRGWRDLFGRKKGPQTLIPNTSSTHESSDTESVDKHAHKPSITIEDASYSQSGPADVGALPYADALLPIPSAQSRHSLSSHHSKGSLTSNLIDAQNENQWKMAYEIAIGALNENERSQINPDTISCTTVYSVLDAANKARADRDESKWRYTKNDGEVVILRDRFDKIVEGFTKYAGLIGSTVQRQQPEATGLVWGAAQSLVEMYLNHKENVDMIEESLKTIAVSMANCEFYASIFASALHRRFTNPETSAAWDKQVEAALPEFYATILVFAIKVKRFFVSSTTGKIKHSLKPTSSSFRPHLAQIEDKEKKLKRLATMATMDGVKGSYPKCAQAQGKLNEFVDLRQKLDIVSEMKDLFVQISDEKALQWLNASTSKLAYDSNKERRLEGTCEWIFKTEKYKTWINGTGNRDLWVVGIPEVNKSKCDGGAGKSVLATSLIDELREQEEILTLYFFFRDGETLTVSPSEMVASIIAQLIRSEMDTERLMRLLKLRVRSSSYFTGEKNDARDLETLCATLIEMVQGFPIPVIILLDALDECTDPSSVAHHLLEPSRNPSSIAHLMLMPTVGFEPPIRFLLTGRPNVHDIFAPLSFVSTLDMEVNEDIRKFVNEKVADNESLRHHENQIVATIYENSQGMLRYAALESDAKGDNRDVRAYTTSAWLERGRMGAPDAAQTTPMGNIGQPASQSARDAIRMYKYGWTENIRPRCINDEDQLRFTHRTVKEFLLQPLDKLSELSRANDKVTSCMVNEAEGNAWMAMTCDDKEQMEGVMEAEAEGGAGRKSLHQSPFNYAVCYWLKHAMDIPHGMETTLLSKPLWELVRDFFWDQSGYSSGSSSLRCLSGYAKKSDITDCLQVAASYRLVDILEWAHPSGVDFNAQNGFGVSPLMYTALLGEEDSARVILSRSDVDINRTKCESSTSLAA
ncbi:11711_t:CDS:10, partial [Acaulospora colombiana]